jgi:hypothetical protein
MIEIIVNSEGSLVILHDDEGLDKYRALLIDGKLGDLKLVNMDDSFPIGVLNSGSLVYCKSNMEAKLVRMNSSSFASISDLMVTIY